MDEAMDEAMKGSCGHSRSDSEHTDILPGRFRNASAWIFNEGAALFAESHKDKRE